MPEPSQEHPRCPLRRRLLGAGALRTAGVAGVMSLGGQPATAQAQAQATRPPVLPVLLSPTLADTPEAAVPFEVAGEAENRLVFATLRCDVPLRRVTLLDPAGRVVWRRTATELGQRPRQTMPQPERGEGYFLPPVRDAAPGRWQLHIEREPATRGAGRLQLAYSVFPRFELDITPATQKAAAGQPLLVTVRPRDYGAPLSGLSAIDVQVLDAQGRPVARVAATEHARSREGITLASEPGVYVAALSLAAAGRYRLQVTQRLGAAAASTRTAVAELVVDGPAGALSLQAVRLDRGPGGCARGLLLDFDVQAARAGLYACNLTLRAGNPALPRASASAELPAGPGRITVAVDAAKLAALGLPWQRLDRAVLLHAGDAEFRVVAELTDIDLTTYGIDFSALCR